MRWWRVFGYPEPQERTIAVNGTVSDGWSKLERASLVIGWRTIWRAWIWPILLLVPRYKFVGTYGHGGFSLRRFDGVVFLPWRATANGRMEAADHDQVTVHLFFRVPWQTYVVDAFWFGGMLVALLLPDWRHLAGIPVAYFIIRHFVLLFWGTDAARIEGHLRATMADLPK